MNLYKKLVAWVFLSITVVCLQAKAEHYVVGVENVDYLPFSAIREGQLIGYYRDLLEAFGKDSGHSFTYRPYPVKRLMNALVAGQIDFKVPDNPYWAAEVKANHDVIYSRPITLSIDGVMVRPEYLEADHNRLSSIATVLGFTPVPFIDDIKSGNIKLNEVTSLEAVIRMVDSKRVDGGFANVTVINALLTKEFNRPGLLIYNHDLPSLKSDISISTMQQVDVIHEFNDWLERNAQAVNTLKSSYDVP